MAMRIIMAVCMLPVLPIMLGACWFLAGEKNGTQFGITLWKGAGDQPQVLEIQRLYKRELLRDTFICLLLFCLALLPEHESLMIAGMTIWIFFAVAFLMLPFQRANKRMREQKQEYLASLPQGEMEGKREEILVDVTAAGADKHKISQKGLYAGCIFALLAPVAEIFLYRFYPRPWLPKLWVCELTLISVAGAAWCFPLFLAIYGKQRTKVFTYNSQVNMQVAGIRKFYLGRFCTVMAWLTGAFCWGMLGAFYVPSRWFLGLAAAISIIFGTASIVLIYRYWQKIQKASGKYLAQEPLVEEDDDKYWIWGMFYYNKNDSRRMVEQRAGIGTTFNFARPGIRYGAILAAALLIGGMLGMCGWVIAEEFTPVTLFYEDGTLMAKHWKKVYQIDREDVRQVVLLEEEPEIRRKSGTGMKTVKKGDFYSDTYRRDFKVCLNPQEPPFLMVECVDGRWYLLGGSDGEATRDLLNKIQPWNHIF